MLPSHHPITATFAHGDEFNKSALSLEGSTDDDIANPGFRV